MVFVNPSMNGYTFRTEETKKDTIIDEILPNYMANKTFLKG